MPAKTDLWQQLNGLAQGCFTVTRAGDHDRHSVAQDGGVWPWVHITGFGDPDEDGRRIFDVNIVGEKVEYHGPVFATEAEIATITEHALEFAENPQTFLEVGMEISPDLTSSSTITSTQTSTTAPPSEGEDDNEDEDEGESEDKNAIPPAIPMLPGDGTRGDDSQCQGLIDALSQIVAMARGSAPRVITRTGEGPIDPTVNPNPDSAWDTSGVIGACGSTFGSPSGAACVLPLMCGTDFSPDENCDCVPRQDQPALVAIPGGLDCVNLNCPPDGECVCNDDSGMNQPAPPPRGGPGGDPAPGYP
jgi:hypothetical protein